MRVVHAILSIDCGGAERVLLDLLHEGVQRGHDVSAFCLERPGEWGPEVERSGGKLVCAEKSPGWTTANSRRIQKLLSDLRPDVVHTHQIGVLFHIGAIVKRLRIPVLLHTEHGKHYEQRTARRWVARFAALRADRFCCVSQDIADAVTKHWIVPRSKTAVVGNGIDTRRFRVATAQEKQELRREWHIPLNAPLVGTVGRLNEVKRQDVLIRGFAGLRAQLPDAHLLLVGDGPERSSLEALAKELLPSDCVHFAGFQKAPERFLAAMDAFALTSRSEGMPLAVLESWSAGVPVVASQVGGVPELIEPGRNGWMFPNGDDAALTAILTTMLKDRDATSRVVAQALSKIEAQYSIPAMLRRYEEHYENILLRKNHRT